MRRSIKLFVLALLSAFTMMTSANIGVASAAPGTGKTYLPMMVGTGQPSTTNNPSNLVVITNEVVNLTNQERAEFGCPALAISDQLTQAAQGHAEDMAATSTLSHTGSDGSSPWDRILATGYTYSAAAENVAAGYQTPESVVQGWMNSEGHRNNILNCDLTEIGVGYALSPTNVPFWTQVFATPR